MARTPKGETARFRVWQAFTELVDCGNPRPTYEEIAGHSGLHLSTVSRWMRTLSVNYVHIETEPEDDATEAVDEFIINFNGE